MVITRRFTFTDPTITASIADETNEFFWAAYATDGSNCVIKKLAFIQPNQVFFSLDREVTNIPAMEVNSTHLFVAYDDSSLLGERISLNNPLTSTTEISIPIGITEAPVDVKVDGSNLWFLIPGAVSGTNAKLLRYNTSGTLQETIDLTDSLNTVTNAQSMDIDSNSDIWVVTYEDPTRIVRVYELSGGGFAWEIHDDFT